MQLLPAYLPAPARSARPGPGPGLGVDGPRPPARWIAPPHPRGGRRPPPPPALPPASAPAITASELEFEIAKARSSGKLDLTERGLTEIPEEILSMDGLRELSLVGNRITSVPEGIARMAGLERLGLAGNFITTLPESIAELEELQGLWLHGNCLESLPQLPDSLRTLALSGNMLRALPPGLEDLTSLEHLSASGNFISDVPEGIGALRGLRHLALNGNMIEEVPGSIGGMRMLQELMLQGNKLRAMPKEWTGLKFLKDISLADNLLESLEITDPDSLVSLQTLYIYGNLLTALPYGLGRLPSLKNVWAEGNPLEAGPLAEALGSLKGGAIALDGGQAAGLPADVSTGRGRVRVSEYWGAGAQGYFKLERAAEMAAGPGADGIPATADAPVLLVAFGSAPGLPNWGGLLKRMRAEHPEVCGHLDVLYVADPARGWYRGAEQDGDGSYWSRLEAVTPRYKRVVMLGDSMGATAALLFAPLATSVVSFCPQLALALDKDGELMPIVLACIARELAACGVEGAEGWAGGDGSAVPSGSTPGVPYRAANFL